MPKLPAIQWYVGDWGRDAVAGCSLAARGLWLEMLHVMHDCTPYGFLAVNGLAMPDEVVARRCRCTVKEYNQLLAELMAAGVPRRSDSGVIYSKRMVDDDLRRANDADRQRRHRDKDVTVLSQPSSSSSSSSISSSTSLPKPKLSLYPDSAASFAEFWEAYPRKVARVQAERAWRKVTDQLPDVLAGLEAWKRSQQWTDLNFVPYPATWLNGKRWKERPMEGVNGASGQHPQASRGEQRNAGNRAKIIALSGVGAGVGRDDGPLRGELPGGVHDATVRKLPR